MVKQASGWLLRIAISAFSLGFLIHSMKDQLPAVRDALVAAHPGFILSAFLLALTMTALASLRLKEVMRVQSIRIPFKDVTRLNLMGYFFNNFLPTAVGGDLIKAYYITKHTGRKLESISALVMDRLLGFSALILIAMTALVIMRHEIVERTAWWSVLTLMTLFVGMTLFFGSRRLARRFTRIGGPFIKWPLAQTLQRFYHTIHVYRSHRKRLASAFIWAVSCHLVIFAMNYILARSLSPGIPFAPFLVLVPLTCFASMIPSINGLGVREGAYVFFFSGMLAPEKAFALSLLWLATLVFLSAMGGLVYLWGAGGRLGGNRCG